MQRDSGQHVLVVEDSYLVALDLTEALEREGADLVGPAYNLDKAHRLSLETRKLDAAVLDVNLRGRMVWPVAGYSPLTASRTCRNVEVGSPVGATHPARTTDMVSRRVTFRPISLAE